MARRALGCWNSGRILWRKKQAGQCPTVLLPATFHTSWKIFMAIAGLMLLLICTCDALSVARAAAITVAWWCGEQMKQHRSWDSWLRRCLCLFLCLGQLPCILPFWIFAKSFEPIRTLVNISGALHLERHDNMLVFCGTRSLIRFVEHWVCGALNNLAPKSYWSWAKDQNRGREIIVESHIIDRHTKNTSIR